MGLTRRPIDVVEGSLQAGAGAQAPIGQNRLQELRGHESTQGGEVPQVPQQEPEAQESEGPGQLSPSEFSH